MASKKMSRLLYKLAVEVVTASKASKAPTSSYESLRSSFEAESEDVTSDINYLEPPDEYIPLKVYPGSFTYPVSGESFQVGTFQSIANDNPDTDEVIVEVLLVPFPENPFDSDAVAVTHKNMMLGYIPRVTAKAFARFLGDDCGSCSARVYLNREDLSRCSVELNVMFPPKAEWEEASGEVTQLSSDSPSYTFSSVTTKSTKLAKLALLPGETHEGWAFLNEGYTQRPWIQDRETLEEIGKPKASINCAFNVFCRAYGGQVLVRYLLTRELEGKLKLRLDESVLPEFHERT
jgi:HIRAN domain